MLKLNVIREIEPDIYASSINRAQLDNKSVTELAKFLLENKFNQEKLEVNGENFSQILFEGVDRETYNKLLSADYEMVNKRVQIIKNGKKGPVKYWMINFIDTMSKEFLYKENEAISKNEVIK